METVGILRRTSILVISIISCVWVRTTSANEGYLVVMPKVFRPNVEEVLSVTILKPTQPIYVEAKLFSKTGHLLVESGHEIFGKGTLKVKTPKDTNGMCTLKICGNCRSAREGSFSFYNSTLVTIEEKGTSVFLQTDKPVYKPGQIVHINVFMTGPDLLPVNQGLILSLLDPNSSQITKWTNLRPLCCGLINVTFPLSEQPVLGTWTVRAQVQGQVYKRQFDILHYVLPKFEVSITAPLFIRDWNVCERITVSARYTFGQDVQGMVKLQFSVHGIGYYSDHFSPTLVHRSQIDGTASFNVCVSDVMPSRFPDHFRGQLHLVAEVTIPDGSVIKAIDDSCPVNKQLVDLQFSRDTRHTFKPGLPFKGRVLVQYPDGSAVDNVTVLVEALVDGIDFSRESVITSHGDAHFYIPPLPAVAQSMSLNAKVISLGEELMPEYYFSAYLTVNSWYSPSKCHLLIDSKTNNYKVGEETKFMVHSTCPCNLDMYYEVKARGNIVHSGIHFSRHEHKRMNPTTDASKIPIFFKQQSHDDYGAKTCTVFIKFLITHEMAPLSRLLVYYVRPSGEGVADAIVFEAQPDFRNKMSIELSDPDAMPGEDIKLHVRTRPGSCVCLGAVDKSVHLLKPDYMLSKEQIFAELETYDLADQERIPSQYHTIDHHHGYRDKRSTSWQPVHTSMSIRDAQYAFEVCGLLVMTDTVSLQFRQDSHTNDGLYFEGPTFEYQIAQLMAEQKEMIHRQRSRVYFPETWIWSCFNTSTTRKDNPIVVQVPDSITTWVFTGASMSPKHGFSLAPAATLRTFQYFFLDLTLPYSVVRKEQVKIPLTVHNYLHACVRVYLELHIPNTLEVLHGKEILKKFCIGNKETKTLFYDMIFKQLGVQKISATAEAYADSRCCSGILTDESPNKRYLTGMDSIKQQLLVEPEGLARYYTHSVYFCPNSRIQLSTPNKYQFQYVARPPEMTSFTFKVKAKNDARIALSPGPKDHDQMIEIVIGGDFNQQSWMMLADTGDIVSNITTPGILSEEEFRSFWISWKGSSIRIGWGSNKADGMTQFLIYEAKRSLFVEYIGFSTGWGSEGEFTIWERREMDGSGYGEVMYLSLPDNAIVGSAFARAKLTGDLMEPSIHHLDKMLRLPQGCGEQNMANFAPNVYILQYLDNTGQLKRDVKLRAIKLLTKGYQKQLTYKRRDGSYSAFGFRDATGNTWLSAFVMKTLAQARQYIYIDDRDLDKTKEWIMNRQRPDGSFESVGRLINKEIQGGIPGRIALTAYVLTAIRHVGVHEKMEHLTVYSAQRYLEDNAQFISDPYTAALTAYALSILNSDRAFSVLKMLSQMAIKRNGMTYWRLYHHEIREFHLFNEEPSKVKVSSAEIEIAGYAALAYLSKADVSSAFPIIKWLTTQRNSYGGFSSTQDTVVALQALSQYSIQSYSRSLAMTVSLASTNMDLLEKFELNSNNSDVIQSVVVPSLPARLFLSASGDGCAMFQVEVQYNVPDPTGRPAFDLWVRLGQHQKSRGHRHLHKPEVRVTTETCMKWLHPGSSNMAVLEMSIITGYVPDVHTLDNLMNHGNLKLKRYEMEGRKINFYFDEIRSGCVTCLSFELIRKFKVEGGSSAPIRIYDYYEPGYEAEIVYNASYIGGLSTTENNRTDCSPIFGCNDDFPIDDEETLCSCYRDCHDNGPEVCASDARMYHSQCHMEVHACHRDLHLEEMPLKYCEVQDMLSGEGSGDFADFAKYGSTISWVSFLMSSQHNHITSMPWMPTFEGHALTTDVTTTISPDVTNATHISSESAPIQDIFMLDNSLPQSNDTDNISDYNTYDSDVRPHVNDTMPEDLDADSNVTNSSMVGTMDDDQVHQDKTKDDSRLVNATISKPENLTVGENMSNQSEQIVADHHDNESATTGVDNMYTSISRTDVNNTLLKRTLVYKEADPTIGPVLKVLEPTTMRLLEQKLVKAELKQAENDWKSVPETHVMITPDRPTEKDVIMNVDVTMETDGDARDQSSLTDSDDNEERPGSVWLVAKHTPLHQGVIDTEIENDHEQIQLKQDVPSVDNGLFHLIDINDQLLNGLTDADIEKLLSDTELDKDAIQTNVEPETDEPAAVKEGMAYVPPHDTTSNSNIKENKSHLNEDTSDLSEILAGDISMEYDADGVHHNKHGHGLSESDSHGEEDSSLLSSKGEHDEAVEDPNWEHDLGMLSDKELLAMMTAYDDTDDDSKWDLDNTYYVIDDDLGESINSENAHNLYGMVSDVVGQILHESKDKSKSNYSDIETQGDSGNITNNAYLEHSPGNRHDVNDIKQLDADENKTAAEKHKFPSSKPGDTNLDTGQPERAGMSTEDIDTSSSYQITQGLRSHENPTQNTSTEPSFTENTSGGVRNRTDHQTTGDGGSG